MDSSQVKAHYRKAKAYLYLEKYIKALDTVSILLKSQPQNAEWLNLKKEIDILQKLDAE